MGSRFTNCFRSWLLGLNIVLLFLGVIILGFSVYVLLEPAMQAMLRGTGKIHIFNVVVCVFIGIGLLTIVTSLIGCSGAYHENECLLGTYCCLMLFIIFVHISGAFLGYWKLVYLLEGVRTSLQLGLSRESAKAYGEIQHMDIIQMKLECCGVYSHADYKMIPYSCCNDRKNSCGNLKLPHYYQIGCFSLYRNHMEKWIYIFCIISGSIAVVEVFTTFLTMIMACMLRSRKGGYLGVDYE